jgi:hypothetical protein
MAFSLAGLPDYIDQSRDELLSKALFGAESKSKATLHTGIKQTQDVHLLTETAVYQADGCDLTSSGDTTIGRLPITVGEIAIMKKYCTKDLLPKFTQRWLKAGATGELDEITQFAAFATETAAMVARQEEINVWQGDTSLSAPASERFYDGWIKLIEAGSAINGNPTGITVATGISSANIISILQGMYQVMSEDELSLTDNAIRIGMDNFRLFQTALVNANLFHYSGEATNEIMLPGTNIPVQGLNGLNGTDRIYAGSWSNFHVGTDLESDSEEFSFQAGNTPGDGNHYLVARFKAGCGVSFIERIVEFKLVP